MKDKDARKAPKKERKKERNKINQTLILFDEHPNEQYNVCYVHIAWPIEAALCVERSVHPLYQQRVVLCSTRASLQVIYLYD